MLTLAVLAAAAVFNVGVINPDTHLIESYLSCHVDYNRAVALITAEQSHYPDKVLGIFDDDAKAASDLENGARACPQWVQCRSRTSWGRHSGRPWLVVTSEPRETAEAFEARIVRDLIDGSRSYGLRGGGVGWLGYWQI